MGRILQAVGCGAAALVLAGCWPMPGADVNRSNSNPYEQTLDAETVVGLTPLWSWESPTGSVSEPVLSTHGLHVVTGCFMNTLSPETGQVRWRRAVSGEDSPHYCVGVANSLRGESFVSTDGGTVDGSMSYYIESPEGHLAGGFWTRGFVADSGTPGPTADGFLVAKRGETRVDSVLIDGGDHLLVNDVTVGGRTFVLHAFGWTSWVYWPLPGGFVPSAKLTLGDHALFHAGPGVLATEPGPASFGEGVRAYAIADARPGCGPVTAPGGTVPVECPLWATPTDGVPTAPVLSPDGSRLYTRTDAGTLYAIDTATGEVLWTATGLGDSTSLALADGVVYVGTGLDFERTGRVLLFDADGCGAATCAPLSPEGFDLGLVGAVSAVTVANDVVYAVLEHTVHAGVGCLPDGVCDEAWSGPGTGKPVVTGGRLYTTGGTGGPGRLTAYGLT